LQLSGKKKPDKLQTLFVYIWVMKIIRYLLLIILFPVFTFSQKQGTPLLRYYSPTEYKGFAQNWCITQDNRGVMYFGNGKGILEYNGKTWRRFPTTQHTTVLCMTKDKTGRIYIGGENEIGYLAPDSTGEMSFISLNNKISGKENKFTYVWAVHATNEGVCFVAGEKILCWNGKSMSYFYPKEGFFTSFCVNGSLYVMSTNTGLMQLKNGKLKLLPGTETLNDASVRHIGTCGEKIFIASRKGCFTYDTNGLQKLSSESDAVFKEGGLYKGTDLPDGNFALGTTSGKLFILNKEGTVLETIDETKGLEGKSIYALYVDRENELWLAQESGISRVSYTLPIRILDARHGLNGIIRTLLKTNEGFFAATFQGLYKLNENGKFSVHHNITTGANVTIPFQHNSILLSTGEIGTVEIRGSKTTPINPDPYILSMLVTKEDSTIVVAGSIDKAYVFKKTGNSWSTVTTIDSLGDEINSLAQIKNNIWMPTTNKGIIYCVSFTDNTFTKYKLNVYDSLNGLPKGLLEVYSHNDTLYVGCDKGVLVFNEKEKKFVQSINHWNTSLFNPPSYAYLLKADQNNKYWALSNKGIGYFTNDTFFNAPFRRIGFTDYYSLLTEPNGTAYIGGTNGIAIYTPNKTKTYNTIFHTLLTKVIHGKDTLFNGSFFTAEGIPALQQNESFKYNFPFKHNSISFEYASPFFDDEADLSFSYKLDGFESEWSDWVKETRKEYTNLPEGAYSFLVKSKNIYGNESTVARFEFTVLSPWYRTWWAYLLYITFGLILIYLVIKIQTAHLRRENLKLERIVSERTAEVVKQKDEITEKNDKLLVAYFEIEEKQKEILDSIQYAKRIQISLLPTEKYIERTMTRLRK